MEKGNQELLKGIKHLLDEHMTPRFDAIDKRLDKVDKRLDEHDKRFDAVDKRFDEIIDGVARVMESQTKLSLIIENEIRNDINMTNHTVRVLASSVQNLTEYFLKLNDLDVRTNRLESDMRECQYKIERLAS